MSKWVHGQSGNPIGRPRKYNASSDISRIYGLKKFGLTVEQYEEMFILQNGVCAICGKPEVKKQATTKGGAKKTSRLCVDHDHKSGKVRGLLCYRCNTGIGKLNDDPELLRKASRYLAYVVEE